MLAGSLLFGLPGCTQRQGINYQKVLIRATDELYQADLARDRGQRPLARKHYKLARENYEAVLRQKPSLMFYHNYVELAFVCEQLGDAAAADRYLVLAEKEKERRGNSYDIMFASIAEQA